MSGVAVLAWVMPALGVGATTKEERATEVGEKMSESRGPGRPKNVSLA